MKKLLEDYLDKYDRLESKVYALVSLPFLGGLMALAGKTNNNLPPMVVGSAACLVSILYLNKYAPLLKKHEEVYNSINHKFALIKTD